MQVAVVGHGPSLSGAGRGAEIDACDIVVRLHNCEWQTPADYGARYDYGVLPGPWLAKALPGIVRRPARGWLLYRFDRPPQVRPPASAQVICIDRWRREIWAQGGVSNIGRPSPTRGSAAILMAAQHFKPARIWCFGLDNLMAGTTAGYAYPPEAPTLKILTPPDRPGLTEDRHDLAAERRMLDVAARHFNVELVA